jgi:hypothetical protein
MAWSATCTLDLSNMTTSRSVTLTAAPMVTEEDEPTRFERVPWHAEALRQKTYGAASEDTATFVAPRPARRMRLVRVSPPSPTARPEPPVAELVENLSVPPDLDEEAFPPGAMPRSEEQVRIDIIRVARDLGREYGRRGCVLRVDAAGVETMQRHLCDCADAVLAGRLDPRVLAPQLVRHGAVLGEILARYLGAQWSNLTAPQPAQWQMTVPPHTQVSPVARVHRFLLERGREQDLIGFFRQLEVASQRASHVTLV